MPKSWYQKTAQSLVNMLLNFALHRTFLNFAKSCILSCLHNPIITIGVIELKAKSKGVLAGHIVAMVTTCATNLTATCSPMIGQFFDTIIVASLVKQSWYLSFKV